MTSQVKGGTVVDPSQGLNDIRDAGFAGRMVGALDAIGPLSVDDRVAFLGGNATRFFRP